MIPADRSRCRKAPARSQNRASAAGWCAMMTMSCRPLSEGSSARKASRRRRRTRFRTTASGETRRPTTQAARVVAPAPGPTTTPINLWRNLLPHRYTRSKSACRRRVSFTMGFSAPPPRVQAARPTPWGSQATPRRARPLARRLATVRRPALVAMRAMNPCLRSRGRRFGWNVRFITRHPHQRTNYGPVGEGMATNESAPLQLKPQAADG